MEELDKTNSSLLKQDLHRIEAKQQERIDSIKQKMELVSTSLGDLNKNDQDVLRSSKPPLIKSSYQNVTDYLSQSS